jgi:peptidoglycan/LPS O-acetylase OafA/YrhL
MARPPNRWLEWAGQWSYSVYLFHVLALPIYLLFEMPNFGYFFDWFLKMFFIMATSYLFYLLIEYPGHRLARYTARAMEANRETIARRAMKRNGGGVGDGGTVCSMDRAERDKGVV